MKSQFWTLDTLQTLLRSVLKIGGGYAMAKGLADEDAIEAIIAGALTLAAVLWGIAHRNGDKSRQTSLRGLSLLFLGLLLVTGCASGNAVAFRSEQVATDTAYAGLMAWKAYYSVALTNSTQEALPTLIEHDEEVNAASRLFAVSMITADGIRESWVTNSTAGNRKALEIALEVAQAHSSNLVWLVRTYAGQQTFKP